MVDKYDQLEKLKRLHDDGVLSAEEFQAEKARILSIAETGERKQFWGMEERVFCMLIHLSQLLGVILPFIPFIGVIVPVAMWASEKDRSRAVDIHGRNVLNWVISYIIYFAVSLLLMVILIGGVLLVAVIVVNIVFAIMGAIKASNGEYWKYPLALPFFKVPDDAGDEVPEDAQTATASTQARRETAIRTEAGPARTADDSIAAESSNLNVAETKKGTGKTGKAPAGKAKAKAKAKTRAKTEKPETPEPDSAAPRPKATPEEGTPPGSESDPNKQE